MIRKKGRPPKVKEIKRAKALREKGFSYRDIAKLLVKKDLKTVYNWVNYDLTKLEKANVVKTLDKV